MLKRFEMKDFIHFAYLSICQPLIKPTHIIQEQPQDPEFLSLPEEVTQVYLLAELLSGPMCHINLSTRGHINSYLATFLEDDSLFDELQTPDQLSMLRSVLRAESLNSENQSLANNRLVNLMIELKALDIKNN